MSGKRESDELLPERLRDETSETVRRVRAELDVLRKRILAADLEEPTARRMHWPPEAENPSDRRKTS